jgi:hypothetical protein
MARLAWGGRDAMTPDDTRHELDDRLANATLFAWFAPTIALAL